MVVVKYAEFGEVVKSVEKPTECIAKGTCLARYGKKSGSPIIANKYK